MERKEFLKRGLSGLGLLAASPLIFSACKKDTDTAIAAGGTTTTTGSTNGSSASDCVITNTETAGPFPIKDPNGFIITDIRGDRTGIVLDITLSIKNKNTGCGALGGVLVDLWHCDANGDYSEYGSLTNVHWLRGRQTANANGQVSFKTIFPGWYSGRAVHLHVAVYTAAGKNLLTSQIAFPATLCDTVYTTATQFYKKGKSTTSNENDGIFKDGYANELGTFAGSVSAGYAMAHNLVVNG